MPTVISGSTAQAQFDTCFISSTHTDDATAVGKRFTNCRIPAHTVTSDRNIYNNCEFTGALTVAAGADGNILTGCSSDTASMSIAGDKNILTSVTVGPVAGGGSLSITVSGDDNVVDNAILDAAPTDSGTGNVLTYTII